MHMIRRALTDWRYQVHEVIVGRELGAFEDRKRLCMLAVSNGIEFAFDLKPVRRREQSLGEVLENVPENASCWKSLEHLDAKQERDRAAGKGFTMQIVGPESTKVGTIGKGYARIRSTEPLVQHPGNPTLKRLLTVTEHCKVKGIDPNLIKGVSSTRAHEMLGQSVLAPAFEAIGLNLGECLRHQFPVIEPQSACA